MARIFDDFEERSITERTRGAVSHRQEKTQDVSMDTMTMHADQLPAKKGRTVPLEPSRLESAQTNAQNIEREKILDTLFRQANLTTEKLLGIGGMGAAYLALQDRVGWHYPKKDEQRVQVLCAQREQMVDRYHRLDNQLELSDKIKEAITNEIKQIDDNLESLKVNGRRVVAKVLQFSEGATMNEQEFTAFQKEARALAMLRHPNIVTTFTYETTESAAVLVMEHVDGHDVCQELEDNGALPPSRVIDIGLKAATALAALHRAGIIHRDVKPANLFVSHDPDAAEYGGDVKLGDFGLSSTLNGKTRKAKNADAPDAALTAQVEGAEEESSIIGTLYYLSPEYIEDSIITPAMDVYAMGVTCYQLLTGHLPVTGRNALEVFANHVNPVRNIPAPITVTANIPDDLSALIMDMLSRDPANRPPMEVVKAQFVAMGVEHDNPYANMIYQAERMRKKTMDLSEQRILPKEPAAAA